MQPSRGNAVLTHHIEVIILENDVKLGLVVHLSGVVVDAAAMGVRTVEGAAATVGTPRQRVDALPRPA